MIALEFMAANPDLRVRFGGEPVRIWSGQWNRYWRPQRAGYTGLVEDAGVYTLREAWGCTFHCGREKQIAFDPLEPLPGQEDMVLPPPVPAVVSGCYGCTRSFLAAGVGCGPRHWRVRSYGFDDRVYGAPSAKAAKYLDYRAAREAGYFSGRAGFHDYLLRSPTVTEIAP